MGEFDAGMEARKAPSFEEFKAMLRPTGVTYGIIEADVEKCTGCGLCVENCALKNLEMNEAKYPKMKERYLCASCFNCIVACPKEALSCARAYGVEGGFFDVGNPPLRKPLVPRTRRDTLLSGRRWRRR